MYPRCPAAGISCYRGEVSDLAGLLESVEILGETFVVQTEMVDVASGRLRTVVFCRGQVAAHNEATLHGGSAVDGDAESLHELLAAHHRLVIRTFIRRTRSFADRQAAGPAASPARVRPYVPPLPTAAVSLPPIPEDPALGDGLDVRHLYGELRHRIELHGAETPAGDHDQELCARLDRVREALAWVVGQPQFRTIRLDEQARFTLLADRVERWAAAGANPDEAEWIWTDVVAFCGYVAEVNLRADLLEFDQRVIAWGLAALARHGPDLPHLKPLQWLFGRDRALDLLLAGDHPGSADEWFDRLTRLAGDG